MDPDTQEQFDALWGAVKALQASAGTPDHEHNGNDFSRVNWVNVYQKRVYVHHTIQGTAAATASNYGVFWIAPVACYINTFREVHQTAGTDGGTVSLQLEKLTSGVAPDSGSTMLASALSLKSTINTVQNGTITSTSANRTLAVGDRLCMKDSGVLTSVANVTVMVELIVL